MLPSGAVVAWSLCRLQIQDLERTVCTGSTSEMRTVGGEVAFVCAMIADSIQLRDRSVRDVSFHVSASL